MGAMGAQMGRSSGHQSRLPRIRPITHARLVERATAAAGGSREQGRGDEPGQCGSG